MNIIHHGNSYNYELKAILSSSVGQWISFAITSLMYDIMKIRSPHKIDFNQFHMKVSYIMPLTYFIYNMEFNKHFGVNLHGLPNTICLFHYVQTQG
jgi:hypothetical protein